MEPTNSPTLPLHRMWSLSEAATYLQDILIGQAMWRYRIGRGHAGILEEIDGLSLTWGEVLGGWKFVFSLRRNGEWHKASTVVATRMEEDIEEPDQAGELTDRVKEASFELIKTISQKAFPEVLAHEAEQRRIEEEERLRELAEREG